MLFADIHFEITNFKTNNGYGEVGYLISKFLSDFIFNTCELAAHSYLTFRDPKDYSPSPPGPKFSKEQKQKRQSLKLNFSVFCFYHIQYNVCLHLH